jgi:hypothetical protein
MVTELGDLVAGRNLCRECCKVYVFYFHVMFAHMLRMGYGSLVARGECLNTRSSKQYN